MNVIESKILNKYSELLLEYFTKNQISDIINRWNEPHRFYHNIYHLYSMLNKIEGIPLEFNIYKNYIISPFFHDVIYDPIIRDNEDKSIEYLYSLNSKLPKDDLRIIESLITCTKFRWIPNNEFEEIFWRFDNSIILESNIEELFNYEEKIFKEFQFVDYNTYKEKRVEFLEKEIHFNKNIEILISYIKNRKIKVGIYSGSFNPFHLGHLNILQKASIIFDKVIIPYGNNPEKQTRNIEIPNSLKHYQVDEYSGLITDYITSVENKYVDVTLVRGLRNGSDLDYESNQLSFIKDIKPDVKVIYLPCDKEFEHISSSAIRNLEKFNKELTLKYLV